MILPVMVPLQLRNKKTSLYRRKILRTAPTKLTSPREAYYDNDLVYKSKAQIAFTWGGKWISFLEKS